MKEIYKWSICFLLFWCGSNSLYGNAVDKLYTTEADKQIYDQYIGELKSHSDLPIHELVIQTALYFLHTPYVASTLEKEPEGLVVNLREMDCTTFAENTLALARTVRSGDYSFENFCQQLQWIRYREGKITDYTARLHYMTDWFYVNEQKKIIKDMSREIGGKEYPLQLFFISTHPDSYKQLKSQPELTQKMAAIEREINQRPHAYVPENEIPSITDKLQNGDIVCFTTAIDGLDVTHVGIVYKQGRETTFIHASLNAKEVIINPDPIHRYVENIKNITGIIVARPL